MTSPRRIAIVGASIAGVRVVRALRRKGYDREVVLVGAEPHLPYDRPPLSKQFLAGTWEADRFLLEDESFYEGVELHLGARAVGLDPSERRIVLDGGAGIRADHVVIATGAAPRRLPATPGREGLHVLRSLDDAVALRAALDEQPRVAVIGAGFIGSEVAAAARGRGLDVTVLEALEAPVVRGVGPRVGRVLADVHADHGVDVRLGVQVEAIEGDQRVRGVRLRGGEVVPADVVVVGIGAAPVTDWLHGSGVPVDDGVLCDAHCRAEGFETIWAAGDVARWHHAAQGERLRLEHWTNAAEQAMAVANNLLDGRGATPYVPVPYVWTDQYDAKVQVLGLVSGDDDVSIAAGSVDDRRFVATYTRAGTLRGVVGWNWPRAVMSFRPLLEAGASSDEARDHAATLG